MPLDQSTDGITGMVVVAVVVLVAIAVGIVLTSTMAGMFDGGGSKLVYTGGSDTISIDSDANRVTAWDSTGNALVFGDGTAQVTVGTDGGAGTRPHTTVVWASLNSSGADYADYHVANLGNGSASIQYRDGDWWVGYNVTTANESATVTAPAPTPTKRTMVGYRANETHLAIVRGGTIVNATAFSSGSLDVPSAQTWWGGQDELRVWDTNLTSSQFSELESDPIGPLEQGNVTLRLMLDEGRGTNTRVLPSDNTAQLQGDLVWTNDGLKPTQFDAGSDYQFDTGLIEILDGSRMDRLRVAYVEYNNALSERTGFAPTAFDIMMLALLMMVITTAMYYIREMQRR